MVLEIWPSKSNKRLCTVCENRYFTMYFGTREHQTSRHSQIFEQQASSRRWPSKVPPPRIEKSDNFYDETMKGTWSIFSGAKQWSDNGRTPFSLQSVELYIRTPTNVKCCTQNQPPKAKCMQPFLPKLPVCWIWKPSKALFPMQSVFCSFLHYLEGLDPPSVTSS